MRYKIVNLVKHEVTKNVSHLAKGSLLSQLITLGCTPIIIKLYGINFFGISSTIMAVVAILIPLSTLGYSQSIVLAKTNNATKLIITSSILISLLLTILLLIIIAIWGQKLTDILNIERIENYVFFVPAAFFLFAIYEIMQQLMVKKKLFKSISHITIIYSLSINSAKIMLGIINPKLILLIGLSALANGLQASFYYFLNLRKLLKKLKFSKTKIEESKVEESKVEESKENDDEGNNTNLSRVQTNVLTNDSSANVDKKIDNLFKGGKRKRLTRTRN
jgi:O-antigen/teichoic acid export membrane protein